MQNVLNFAYMVEVALLDGNRDKVHSVVERAFEIAEEVRCEELTLECDISKVHNGKAGGSLRAIGVDTVGKLLEMTREELMRVGQINKKSADQIEAKLREFGYELS